MDWDAVINDALFAMKTSGYLGSFGNMNFSNDVVLTDLQNGNIVNTEILNNNINESYFEIEQDYALYYRVQGGGEGSKVSQYRILVNSDGSITIQNKKAELNISAYNLEHAQYYRDTARPGGEIVEFRVPIELDEIIREMAIEQYGYRNNPLNQGKMAPKITDPTTPGVSYELPGVPWVEWLEEYGYEARII